MICKILTRGGHETYQAKNGREALELLENDEKPDCVLTDLSMPDMTGLDLLSGIEVLKLDVPVVVITADIQVSTQKECYDRGALAVINKPLNDDKLKDVVSKAIG
ncbi:MAG: response regulator [Deltaproteobacteria bacterium]|nr:response regulator [Deltaproteobacteria bacterium]